MRNLILSACLLCAAGAASAQQAQRPFEPSVGMPGKDVVWVPTSPDLVDLMLRIADVTKDDFVMDLGSGDGRNIIAAARLGARATGVEFNPEMVALSNRLAAEAGVADRASFIQGDMYEADISKATVLALFLLPVNMNKLVPKFLDMQPGSRIVANTFAPSEWDPDLRQHVEGVECESWCEALLWIVPAKVFGTWTLADGTLVLTQSFQTLLGTMTRDGLTGPISRAHMRGSEMEFIAGGQTYTGTVKGDRIEGMVTTPSGQVPWSAIRTAR